MKSPFAPAEPPCSGARCVVLARVLSRRSPARAANDNSTVPRCQPLTDALLRDALRHFAEHGIGAAQLALVRARIALGRGDQAEFRHWFDITRALDRKLAADHQYLD